MGKVVSGGPGPGPYVVQLYSQGPDQSADTTGPNGEPMGQIDVKCLVLDEDETLPEEMWLFPIMEIDLADSQGNVTPYYWAQPPVWVP